MPPANTNCLKCDKNWYRAPDAGPEACPRCGDRKWDTEYDLSHFIGGRNDYYITGESISEAGLVMTLQLRALSNRENHAQAPLCHRLKSYYRHAKNDLGSRDGKGLMVNFDRLPSDPNGRWGMRIRQQEPWQARRLVTDECRRHRWAIGVHLSSTDINGFADREHCTCPSEPPCEVCVVAAKFAEGRRRSGSDGTAYLIELNHAVMRDLGRM